MTEKKLPQLLYRILLKIFNLMLTLKVNTQTQRHLHTKEIFCRSSPCGINEKVVDGDSDETARIRQKKRVPTYKYLSASTYLRVIITRICQ